MKTINARTWDALRRGDRMSVFVVIGNRLQDESDAFPIVLTDRNTFNLLENYEPLELFQCVRRFGSFSGALTGGTGVAKSQYSCDMVERDWADVISLIQHTGQEVGVVIAPTIEALANDDFITIYSGILKYCDQSGLYVDSAKTQLSRKFPRIRQLDLGYDADSRNLFVPYVFGDFSDDSELRNKCLAVKFNDSPTGGDADYTNGYWALAQGRLFSLASVWANDEYALTHGTDYGIGVSYNGYNVHYVKLKDVWIPFEPTFYGTGLNDLENNKTITVKAKKQYRIEITTVNGLDYFKWQVSTWDAATQAWNGYSALSAEIPCSGWRNIENGLKVQFGNTNGHTLGDAWIFTVDELEVRSISYCGVGGYSSPEDIVWSILSEGLDSWNLQMADVLDYASFYAARYFFSQAGYSWAGKLPDQDLTYESAILRILEHIADIDLTNGRLRIIPLGATAQIRANSQQTIDTFTECSLPARYRTTSIDDIQNRIEITYAQGFGRSEGQKVTENDARSQRIFGRLVGYSRAKTMGISLPYCQTEASATAVALNWLALKKSVKDEIQITVPDWHLAFVELGDDMFALTDDFVPNRTDGTVGILNQPFKVTGKTFLLDEQKMLLTLLIENMLAKSGGIE